MQLDNPILLGNIIAQIVQTEVTWYLGKFRMHLRVPHVLLMIMYGEGLAQLDLDRHLFW